jgi:hypothetical protein
MTDVKDIVIADLPLRQYVAVYAAVGEGFPLETVLAHEELDMETWGDVDRAWSDAIVESVETDLELVEAHDSLLIEAQDRYWRAIPPLSEELGAWLDFYRHVAAHEDAFAFLAEVKLRPVDLTRLHRHWSDRIALEEARRQEALEILQREPGPLPSIAPEPQKLAPRVGGAKKVAPPVALPRGAPPPSSAEAELPPLLAPMPPPPIVAATPLAGPPLHPSARLSRGSLLPEAARPPVEVAPPSVAPPSELIGARLGLIAYASGCAEAEVFPERAASAWLKYGLVGEALDAEHGAWARQFATYPEERAEFESQMKQFRSHWSSIRQRQKG